MEGPCICRAHLRGLFVFTSGQNIHAVHMDAGSLVACQDLRQIAAFLGISTICRVVQIRLAVVVPDDISRVHGRLLSCGGGGIGRTYSANKKHFRFWKHFWRLHLVGYPSPRRGRASIRDIKKAPSTQGALCCDCFFTSAPCASSCG